MVKITDLGNSESVFCNWYPHFMPFLACLATWTEHHFTDNIQTQQYCCPEVILCAKCSTSADSWSVAWGQLPLQPHIQVPVQQRQWQHHTVYKWGGMSNNFETHWHANWTAHVGTYQLISSFGATCIDFQSYFKSASHAQHFWHCSRRL